MTFVSDGGRVWKEEKGSFPGVRRDGHVKTGVKVTVG